MNKSTILAYLARASNVEAGLVGLLARQTPSERATSTTTERNDRGFSMKTDHWGTILAKVVKGGGHLTPRQLEVGRDICTTHWKQVGEILAANAAQAAKVRVIPTLVIQGRDMSYLLARYDRFQVFPGIMQHA